MFYCNDCAKKHSYPETMFQSYGRCEIYKQTAVCNERASSLLPDILDAQDVEENDNAAKGGQ